MDKFSSLISPRSSYDICSSHKKLITIDNFHALTTAQFKCLTMLLDHRLPIGLAVALCTLFLNRGFNISGKIFLSPTLSSFTL